MTNPMKTRRVDHGGKIKFKKNDTVIALSGDDKGRHGKVLQVLPSRGMALVEGLNLVKKHLRKSQEHPRGTIAEKEAPIPVCKLRKYEAADAKAKEAARKGQDGAQ